MNNANSLNIIEAARLADTHVAAERAKLQAAFTALQHLTAAQAKAAKSQEGIERYLLEYRQGLCSALLR
jgi:hypothetical protein